MTDKSEYRNRDGLTEEEFLKQYKPSDYERPSVTVDTLLFGMDAHYESLKILLIKRNNHPYINKWAFPGGFVDIDESSYTAACRELEEETGLTDIYLEQLYTVTAPDRDPRMRVIDIAYLALLPECPVRAGDDAKDAAWFDVRIDKTAEGLEQLILFNRERDVRIIYELHKEYFRNGVIKIENYGVPLPVTEEQLAFDHAQILVEGLMRLRNKAEYTDIAFNLMPDEFTMTDLMRVYELILGKKLYRKNFRDKMKCKTELDGRTDYSKSTNGLTPSELYRYNVKN